MPALHSAQGKLKLDLNSQTFQKSIVDATFDSILDDSSILTVTVAHSPVHNKDRKLSHYPESANLNWDSKLLFQGHILSVEVLGASKTRLTYRDPLYLASKTSVNEFSKQETLETAIRSMISQIGLGCRFSGDFGENWNSFSQTNETILEALTSLSYSAGFFFSCKSAGDSVALIRLGSYLNSANIDVQKQAVAFSSSHSISEEVSEFAYSYFEPGGQETQYKNLTRSDLLGKTQSFSEHSTHREKAQWRLSKGKMETFETDVSQHENGGSAFRNEFSKRAMAQEMVTLRLHEPLAWPGDRIELKNTSAPSVQDGAYFVQSARLKIHSSLPLLDLTAIRA
jgi:hypothetical protein